MSYDLFTRRIMLYIFNDEYPDYAERMKAIQEAMWFWMTDDDVLLTVVSKG